MKVLGGIGEQPPVTLRRTLTVFMGSPGDLPDERDAVQATIVEMNRNLANPMGFHLDLVRWEDSAPGFGNPQDRINLELDRADLFIGLLHRKLGSRADSEGPDMTGFEVEFQRSLTRRKASGAPEMMMLFRVVPPEFMRDIGPDLRKVLDFREALDRDKPLLYQTFADVADLEKQLRSYLSRWIHSLGREEVTAEAASLAEPIAEEEEVDSDVQRLAFSAPGAEFLGRLAVDKRKIGALTSAEAARFRLLGVSVHQTGNDVQTLGVHDANVLFSDCAPALFGCEEVDGLISSGLDHYRTKTVPLWTWLARKDPALGPTLSDGALLQLNVRRRVGALSALQFLGLNLKGPLFDRTTLIQLILAPAEDREVRAALLQYLGDHGVEDDLQELWRAHADTSLGQADEIAIVILHILARFQPKHAFRALLDMAPSSPPRSLVDEIFSGVEGLPEGWLIEAFGHRAARVRIAALQASDQLTADRAHWCLALTRDEDPDVRAAAVASLEASGEMLSPEDARGILVRTNRTGNALLWNWSRAKTETGTSQWYAYRRLAIRRWSQDQKRSEAARDRDADAMLDLAGGEKDLSILRQVVDKKGEINPAAGLMNEDGSEKPLTAEESISLYQRALDRLAERLEAADVGRVRNAFGDARIELPETAYRFLAMRGSWSDAELIIKASGERRGTEPKTLLSITDRSEEYRWAAHAIVALAGGDWTRLLSLRPDAGVFRQLILAPPRKVWALLSDEVLLAALSHTDDLARELAALRCVRDLPVKRIKGLAAKFQKLPEHRYYSTIHWLDFGVAISRGLAVPAVSRRLATYELGATVRLKQPH
jgi:hypothetical protein